MKYLLFNGIVAAALIYLVAGDKIDIKNPLESLEDSKVEISEAVKGDAIDGYQQTVMETAKQVATITAERVAEEVTKRLLQDASTQSPTISDEYTQAMPTETQSEILPEIQEEYVEVSPEYVIDEASAVEGTDEPILAGLQDELISPAIQLAEGEQFMSARDRQKELDTLAQNMEFLFLSTQ